MSTSNGTEDITAETAVQILTETQFPSFNSMLDQMVAFRVGQLLEMVSDGYTVREALLGKSIHLKPTLFTQKELRSLRHRGKMPYVKDKFLAEDTCDTIIDSLRRLSLWQFLDALDITIGVKQDKFAQFHIVFVSST